MLEMRSRMQPSAGSSQFPLFLVGLIALATEGYAQQATPLANPPQTEDKRIFWIIPNFRTSPSLNPYTPLTVAKKFELGSQDSFDRGTMALAALFAGEAQLSNSNRSFGQGVAGYARFSGAYPVADEEPCTSRDMAESCAKLLNVPVTGTKHERPDRMPRFANNRRVDGSAMRNALGIKLTYPSYRVGVPAAISGETTTGSAGCQRI